MRTSQRPAPTSTGPARLTIGEVAALTGITPGRIRHYEARGLLSLAHAPSGYRFFRAADVLRLLHIDLLRSLGFGLAEIRESLGPDEHGLVAALARHRQALLAERARLDRLVEAVDQALAHPDQPAEAVAAHVASAHRDSLGIFGRLTEPLSDPAAETYADLLGGWELPVSPVLGRLMLPAPVTGLLERLAQHPGHPLVFDRMRKLAAEVMSLSQDPQATESDADHLARRWVDGQLAQPLPPSISAIFEAVVPRMPQLDTVNQGFQLWAESISPLAARVLRTMQAEARRAGASLLGAIVVGPAEPRRHPARPLRRLHSTASANGARATATRPSHPPATPPLTRFSGGS